MSAILFGGGMMLFGLLAGRCCPFALRINCLILGLCLVLLGVGTMDGGS